MKGLFIVKRLPFTLFFVFLFLFAPCIAFQASNTWLQATIHIEAKASPGPIVWHGLAIDWKLAPAFPASQPQNVIGEARINFSYTTTVQLSVGKHQIEYGVAQYNGSLPYPWNATLFFNGKKIQKGVVRENQHLIADLSLKKPVSPFVDLFIQDKSDLLLFGIAASLFTILYAGYILSEIKDRDNFQ